MREYEKIETVFNRDIDGSKKLIPGFFRNETVEYLKDNIWEFTEKVDGTNIRIHWDGHNIEIGGRTDRADIPKHLLAKLESIFKTDEAEELFEQTWGDKEVILFGEGYGKKIQEVGNLYNPDDVDFILFDVLVGDNYQERLWVEETARIFGVKSVPVLIWGTIGDGIRFVMAHPNSTLANLPMEGVVGRPYVEMRDRVGKRVIVKIKWKDFKDFDDRVIE